MTVQITRLEHDADALRQHAARASAAPVARRLLALALVLAGLSRADAANSCGMDRQTLRDWVIRYNEHGIAGLADLPRRGGAAPKLSVEEKAVLTEWVQQGPDLAEDGIVRWRLCDLRIPNSDDSSASVFSPDNAAIATRAFKSALCRFLFTPTSHASLDRSALCLSHCPENRAIAAQGVWAMPAPRLSSAQP
jgi:transposase